MLSYRLYNVYCVIAENVVKDICRGCQGKFDDEIHFARYIIRIILIFSQQDDPGAYLVIMMLTINLLKSSELVADIQNCFGLRHSTDADSDDSDNSSSQNSSAQAAGTTEIDAVASADPVEDYDEETELRRRKKIGEETEGNVSAAELNISAAEEIVSTTNGIDPAKPLRSSATDAAASDAREEATSVADSLMNSGLEDHGIFSVCVAAKRVTTPNSSGDEQDGERERHR